MDNISIINGVLQFDCEEVGQLEGFDVPTSRTVFVDPPEVGGSLFINELPGRRTFSWRGLIKDDIQNKRRELSRICRPGGLKLIKFQLCDGLALQAYATVVLNNPYSEQRSPYLITATSPDDAFESQTEKNASTGITIRTGGLPVPAAIPAPIGGGANIFLVVVNDGDVAAKPLISVRGPGTNFVMQNVDTGEQIDLALTLADNEIVTINTKTNDVLKGNQSLFGKVTRTPLGQWVTIAPGTNRFVFKAQNGYTANTRMTLDWRDLHSGT